MEAESPAVADLYPFTPQQSKLLSGPDRVMFRRCFKTYDLNGDKNMDEKEFEQLMKDLG